MTRAGFALPFAVLLVLMLTLVGLGMMAAGAREREVARATLRTTLARTAAEARVRQAVHEWSTRDVADLELGATRLVSDGPTHRITVERTERTAFFLWGEARVGEGRHQSSARAGVLIRAIDPGRTGRAFPAAATATSIRLSDGAIHGRDACPLRKDTVGARSESLVLGPTATLTGDPPVRTGPALEAAPATPFGDVAPSIADLRPEGSTITPAPRAEGGACVPGSGNWGAVSPGHPCHASWPLVYASGDLAVVGGEARAVLVVDGDLTLSHGVSMAGLIFVRGTLTVGDGVVVRGAVRAGSLTLDGGEILWDACAVGDGVSAPALDRAFRPAARWWVPAF